MWGLGSQNKISMFNTVYYNGIKALVVLIFPSKFIVVFKGKMKLFIFRISKFANLFVCCSYLTLRDS